MTHKKNPPRHPGQISAAELDTVETPTVAGKLGQGSSRAMLGGATLDSMQPGGGQPAFSRAETMSREEKLRVATLTTLDRLMVNRTKQR